MQNLEKKVISESYNEITKLQFSTCITSFLNCPLSKIWSSTKLLQQLLYKFYDFLSPGFRSVLEKGRDKSKWTNLHVIRRVPTNVSLFRDIRVQSQLYKFISHQKYSRFQCAMTPELESLMGSLQNSVTWYKIRLAG